MADHPTTPPPPHDVGRPFQLRLILDVAVTEEEWAILSQAYLPHPPAERRLAVMVWDSTVFPDPSDRGVCGGATLPGEATGELVLQIDATPANLVLNQRHVELEHTPHLVPDPEADPVVVTKASPLEILEADDGPPVED